MTLLRLENVTKRFGGLVAVDRVNMEIHHGEFVGIVGPNGSGKTTLFNVINGVFLPEEGHLFFEDKDITNMPAHKRAPLGIGRTFQFFSYTPNISVKNIFSIDFFKNTA